MKNDSLFAAGAALVFCALFFLYVLRLWLHDLVFYKKNKWDFSQDSGVRAGPTPDAFPALYQYSAKFRVCVLLPILLIFTLLCLVLAGREYIEIASTMETMTNG